MHDINKIVIPKKGQVVFMHFLSPKSYDEYHAKGERYSHNDAVEDDHAIDNMLQSIGHPECKGKPFLSMFAITHETYKAVLMASRAYGELYRAFVLDPTELAKHTVLVFNGDVKNLSQAGKLPSSVIFVGDEESMAEAILGWHNKLDVHARETFFSEARLYGPLSASLVKEEYGYPGSESELAAALDNALEDEDTDF